MAITYEIKKLLGGSSDERLEIIEKRTRERLLLILGSDLKEVPPELEYVVLDVSLKRFNRIGSRRHAVLLTRRIKHDLFRI